MNNTDMVVQEGRLGLNSPKLTARYVVVITRGIMSRTGAPYGNVDEGFCVQVTGYGELSPVTGERVMLVSERLHAPDRYDPAARNRIGTLGAYCYQRPAESEVSAAVERARAALIAGTRYHEARRVAAEVAP